ncbi:hypothetical protein Tco_0803677 [Tanacetum coccineum]|uniref:Uncharacterized protein n=1 Tax=Tanacetum coccineum TaxID=301880 RepID=A0ABQ5A289_9ASTR
MTFTEFNRLSGMDDDLFTYEVRIPGLSYPPHGKQQCDDPEYCNDLDIYEPRICYDKNKGIYAEAKQFNEYIEIKKQWMTHGIDADMEYDPSDVDFVEWIASKFSNHSTMDWYTKNALWMYWIIGDDEEVLTDKELYDLEGTHVNAYDEVTEIFRIETNIFDFETPLCNALNEFNYLLKIDTNLLTRDIPGFKTYDEYKNAWIYEWDKDVPWVPEEPWSKNRVPYEIIDHFCVPLHEDDDIKSEALMKMEES